MKNAGKTVAVPGLLLLLLTTACLPAMAGNGHLNSYTYDSRQNAVPAPDGYALSQELGGGSFGLPVFAPVDMAVDEKQNVYILDDAGKSIVILDKDLKPKKVIEKVTATNGTEIKGVKKFSGICVHKDLIYIADTEMGQILKVNMEGVIQDYISLPQTPLIPESYVFKPLKIIIDSQGILYILCEDLYQGAVTLNSQNEFLGFFGANRISMNAQLLLDTFWKSISSPEQRGKMSVYVPTEYANFCVDQDDFVYTVTAVRENDSSRVSKFNQKGNDVFTKYNTDFGDLKTVYDQGKPIASALVGVAVSDDGRVAVADKTRGRVFEYDRETNLLFAFGGTGSQKGHFNNPVAIQYQGDRLLVLDGGKATLSVFEETDYGRLIHESGDMCDNGLYREAQDLLRDVLKLNSNNQTTYLNLGKSYLGVKDYKAAMENFKLADSPLNYSEAFKSYRNNAMKTAVPFLLGGLVLVFVLIKLLKPNRKLAGLTVNPTCGDPLRVISRPLRTFQDLQTSKNGNILIAAVLLLLWLAAEVLNRQYAGFIFNDSRPQDFNILVLAGGTLGLFVCFVICNWAVGTLADGSGKLVGIFTYCAYALTPYILYRCLHLILSNVLTADEGVFLTYLGIILMLWTVLTMLSAIMAVHDYSFKQALFSLVLTVLGVVAVLFILLLLVNLFMQFGNLIRNILTELSLR